MEELKSENEELKEQVEHVAVDEVATAHAEAYARIEQMPTWNLVRHEGSGRGGACVRLGGGGNLQQLRAPGAGPGWVPRRRRAWLMCLPAPVLGHFVLCRRPAQGQTAHWQCPARTSAA